MENEKGIRFGRKVSGLGERYQVWAKGITLRSRGCYQKTVPSFHAGRHCNRFRAPHLGDGSVHFTAEN
jgi:hypothetical protein